MAKILGTETKPEILVRKYLFAQGFRFLKNVKKLSGKPDIVLPKYKTVIFINGCFWHGHSGCLKAELPKSNKDFWQKKILANIVRDKQNNEALESGGWKVHTIWQCELKNKTLREDTLEKLSLRIIDSSGHKKSKND